MGKGGKEKKEMVFGEKRGRERERKLWGAGASMGSWAQKNSVARHDGPDPPLNKFTHVQGCRNLEANRNFQQSVGPDFYMVHDFGNFFIFSFFNIRAFLDSGNGELWGLG